MSGGFGILLVDLFENVFVVDKIGIVGEGDGCEWLWWGF